MAEGGGDGGEERTIVEKIIVIMMMNILVVLMGCLGVCGGEGEEGVFEREENRSGKIKEKERRRIKRRGRA